MLHILVCFAHKDMSSPKIKMDMITTYKIIRGLVEVPHQDLFTISCNTTRSNGKLYKERANTNTRLIFFTNRIINDWNTLPTDIVNVLDTTSFKTLLDIYWRDSRFIYNLCNLI